MAHSGRLGARLVVAEALAEGLTVSDAAARGGVNRQTVQRWKREDKGFDVLVSELRGAMVDRAVGRLADVAVAAVETLNEERREGEKSGDRIMAARAILSHLAALRSVVEFEDRLAALEQAAGGSLRRVS